MHRILEPIFFKRPASHVAQDLLGIYLVRRINDEIIAEMITETEAYEGLDDLASHASKGRTPRTEVMFGEAGKLYIYLVYGMHYMLNVVTGPVGHPAAVLIRGTSLTTGPGRVTKRFHIDKALNMLPAVPGSGLWFEDKGEKVSPNAIFKTPRIGIDYAGPIWSQKEWRFVIKKEYGN